MNNKLNFFIALIFTMTIVSFFGCTPDDDIVIDPTVECDSFLVNIMMMPDSTLEAIVIGGTEPYSFLWSTGETTASINILENGTYSVVVTDDNDCTVEATFDINNPQPCTLTISEVTVTEDPSTGMYTLTAVSNGGTAPYTYYWLGGYTGNPIMVDSPGVYTVQITDSEGCVAMAPVNVEGSSDPCDGFSAGIYVDSLSNNTLTVGAFGGTPPYAYVWSDGSTTATITSPMTGVSYTVTVTDSNGCSAESDLDYTGNEPCSFFTTSITAYQDSLGVNMTTLIANAVGGASPYSYTWSQGSMDHYITVANNSGAYSVTITDQNGCVGENQIEL